MSGYHLCSDNYKNAIFKGFLTLQTKEEFVDLTLAAEGHLVKVHKNIIAVASPYIKALLRSAPCVSPVIFLNNVRHIILQYLIEYIYQGEVDVPEEVIEEFVQVGKALHVNGINSIPKKTSLVFSETTVAKKPESSNNLAAHIRINNINNKHSLEVLQLNRIEPSTSSSVPVIEPINPNVIQIHYGNETGSGFQASNNFATSNNHQSSNDVETGNDFAIGNNFCNDNIVTIINPPTGNDIRNNIEFAIGNNFESGNDIANNNDFAIGNHFETSNSIVTVENLQTGNSFAISSDIGSGNAIATDNHDFEGYNDIVTDSNLQSGNDIMTGNERRTDIESKNNKNDPVFDYKIQVQCLDTDSASMKTVSDVNTELDKIDAKDLKGMAQYSVTERGSTQLVLNRFIYCCQFESRRGHRRRWRCIDYRRSHCPALVETEDGLIVKRKGIHSHPFHDSKICGKHKKGLLFSSEENVKTYLTNINTKKNAKKDNSE